MNDIRYTLATLLVVFGINGTCTVKSFASRTLHFPSDRSMGMLKDLDQLSPKTSGSLFHWWTGVFAWKYADLGKAQGDITVADNQRLGLVIDSQGWRDLSPLAHLAPHDIEILSLKCEGQGTPGDAGLREICKLSGLKTLFLEDSNLTNEGLTALQQLTSLERLHINLDHLDESGIAHIASVASLTSIRLSTGSIITSKALSRLTRLSSLKELYIGWLGLEADGLAHLSQLPKLEFLRISAPDISPTDLGQLKDLPHLRRLHLFTSTGENFPVLPDMPSLKELYVRRRGPGSIALANLAHLHNLETLSLTGRFTDEGIGELKFLNALKEIQLQPLFQDRDFITDEALAHLSAHGSLESLSIYTGYFTDKGLESLSELSKLKQLHIPNNPGFTDAGLKDIAKLTNLEDLYLRGNMLSQAGLKEIETLEKLKKVRFLQPSADAVTFSAKYDVQ